MSTDNKNPHAALIEAYCRDWQETPEPWTRWQWATEHNPDRWTICNHHPTFGEAHMRYRRKPDTVTVNDIEVNAPLRVAPPVGTVYWTVSLATGAIRARWDDDVIDQNILKNGCACATEEDAQALWNAVTAPLRAYVGGGK